MNTQERLLEAVQRHDDKYGIELTILLKRIVKDQNGKLISLMAQPFINSSWKECNSTILFLD